MILYTVNNEQNKIINEPKSHRHTRKCTLRHQPLKACVCPILNPKPKPNPKTPTPTTERSCMFSFNSKVGPGSTTAVEIRHW